MVIRPTIFRAQSGHTTVQAEQRPGVPYDFHHNILIHKTKVPFWKAMSSRNDRHLRCRGRDIHLAPAQFLRTEPDMLRQYGGRVLLETREALRTARETNNGYILVSQDIHLDRLEAVFDLDNDNWEFPYTPETQAPQLVSSQGLDDASHLLHSKVEHKQEVSFGDLPMLQRQVIMDIGEQYLKHLRYPGGSVPADATAGATASAERSSAVRDEAIHRVVTEVFEKAKLQKQRIEAKAMPKDQPVPAQPASDSRPVKGPPTIVLEQRAKDAEKAKHKPPPKRLIEQLQQRPSADTPAKATTDSAKATTESAKATTETTVKLEPKQPKHPPPPKRPADRPAESASAAPKKIKQEEAPPAPPAPRKASQNKMPTPPRAIPPAPTRPAPSAPSRAGPMPPPDVPDLQDRHNMHVPEHQHLRIHRNVLNNQITHHQDMHEMILTETFQLHLLLHHIREQVDPIQRTEDNHCRDNGQHKMKIPNFSILKLNINLMKLQIWKSTLKQ